VRTSEQPREAEKTKTKKLSLFDDDDDDDADADLFAVHSSNTIIPTTADSASKVLGLLLKVPCRC